MNPLNFIGDLFKSGGDAIDKISTSDEEKLSLNNVLAEIKAKVEMAYMQLQLEAYKVQMELAKIDAQSDRWFQWTVRPFWTHVCMVMVVLDSIHLITLKEQAWMVITVYTGGTVITRGVEKMFKAQKK